MPGCLVMMIKYGVWRVSRTIYFGREFTYLRIQLSLLEYPVQILGRELQGLYLYSKYSKCHYRYVSKCYDLECPCLSTTFTTSATQVMISAQIFFQCLPIATPKGLHGRYHNTIWGVMLNSLIGIFPIWYEIYEI